MRCWRKFSKKFSIPENFTSPKRRIPTTVKMKLFKKKDLKPQRHQKIKKKKLR